MDRRHVAVAGVLVAALLLVLVWYPGTFVGPEDDERYYEHRVDPASTPSYEQRLATIADERDSERLDRDGGDVEDVLDTVGYDELSPEGRSTFDRTLETPPGESGAHVYDPFVCKEGPYLCPGTKRDERPEVLDYRAVTDPADAAVIVVTDDERYLFSTGAVTYTSQDGHGFGDRLTNAAYKWLVLIPFACFVLVFTTGAATNSRHRTAAGLGIGAALVAVPYLASDHLLALLPIYVGFLLVVVAGAPYTDDPKLRAGGVALGGLVAMLAVVPSHLLPLIESGPFAEWSRLLTLVAAAASVLALSVAPYVFDSEATDTVGQERSLPWK